MTKKYEIGQKVKVYDASGNIQEATYAGLDKVFKSGLRVHRVEVQKASRSGVIGGFRTWYLPDSRMAE